MPINDTAGHNQGTDAHSSARGTEAPAKRSEVDQSTAGRGTSGATAGGDGPFSIPSLSLPKGGGAIRGIGEKFGVNPATGTGSHSVPIASTPGRSGFGPQL